MTTKKNRNDDLLCYRLYRTENAILFIVGVQNSVIKSRKYHRFSILKRIC